MTANIIEQLRYIIDELDQTIIASIAKRHEVSMQIGAYKEQNGLNVYDKNREQQLHQYHKKLSEEYNVNEEFVHAIFDLIIKQSREIQRNKK
ncbi:MAG: chorismate mutase [Neisseriaceae bacterium]